MVDNQGGDIIMALLDPRTKILNDDEETVEIVEVIENVDDYSDLDDSENIIDLDDYLM